MLLICLEKCIEGHRSLYKAGILHRDISINNLMFREESGKEGLIIDLDLAVLRDRANTVADAAERSQRTRTVTRAFMAIGLLDGNDHTFLHDLESFFWVLFWICIHYGKAGEEPRVNTFFEQWNYATDEQLMLQKRGIICGAVDLEKAARRHFTPYYRPLIPCLCKLRALLPFVLEVPENTGLPVDGKMPIPEPPDVRIYSQMIEVLREAQTVPD